MANLPANWVLLLQTVVEKNTVGDDLRQRTQFLGINCVGSMNNHTRHSLENCLRYATLRKRFPWSDCVGCIYERKRLAGTDCVGCTYDRK